MQLLICRSMLVLRVKRRRAEGAKVGSWNCIFGNIKVRIERGNCGGHKGSESHLFLCQSCNIRKSRALLTSWSLTCIRNRSYMACC